MFGPEEILLHYWSYNEFRPLQREIIQSVLEGEDVLALLPTGGGKSLCYQVPALMTEGLCLVISPLIALMQDQVLKLKERNIEASFIHSGMSQKEIERILSEAAHQKLKLLYVAPERLQSSLFLSWMRSIEISFIAVDEAHCISQWGHDFRPSYLDILEFRNEFRRPVIALTATASELVKKDIVKFLDLKKYKEYKQSYARSNIQFIAEENENKPDRILNILQKIKGSSIIYTRSRKKTIDIANYLSRYNIQADYYHAGLNHEEREEKMEQWLKSNTAMVSTNAFGMGIDKPDVRLVLHVDLPPSLEEFYQEAGRAGRDGKNAYSVLLYAHDDELRLLGQLEEMFPDLEELRAIYRSLCIYCKIGVGDYNVEPIDFDVYKFIQYSETSYEKSIQALKLLQQTKWIFVSDAVFSPSKFQFIAAPQQIRDLEGEHPMVYELCRLMARSYEGIFSLPVTIKELFLAKQLKTTIAVIQKALHYLDHSLYATYRPSSNQSRIQFLKERPSGDQIVIDRKWYEQRKKISRERVFAMLNYFGKEHCRQQFVLDYFDEANASQCGRCDFCLKQKNSKVDGETLNLISLQIREYIERKKQATFREIYHLFPSNKRHWVEQIVSELLEEKILKQEFELLKRGEQWTQ
ncbi:MAG TPA: RecQ family ATP-dependent DNA helicase [Saprospiraceae bacterium]|nr:RecQ family ATP-dependent DNA helicase [Saprospiraceae bacterium]